MSRPARPWPGPARWPLVPAALLLLAGCADEHAGRLSSARRGDLEITLGLRGTLQAARDVSIKSPRWGEIKRMAANGSPVKADDVVLELVADDVENSLRENRADVEVRSAELREAEQETARNNRAAELRLAAARLDRELEEALVKELAARPTERELTEAAARAELAKALVAAAGEAVGLVKELVASGYAPQEDLRQAERDLLAARAEQAAAEARAQAVKDGPTAFERQQAALRLESARFAEQAAAKNVQAVKELGNTKVARCRRRLEREKEKTAESERRLAESTVRAPAGGVVLHAQRRWGGVWQVGQQTWQSATIMTIPDFSGMKVTVQVAAERVRELEGRELAARVQVVAMPGRVFPARLVKVSAIGKDEFESLDPSTTEKLGRAERQVFEAEVVLDENDARLRPGLTAETQIVLRRIQDAVIVPLVALVPQSSGAAEPRAGNKDPKAAAAPEGRARSGPEGGPRAQGAEGRSRRSGRGGGPAPALVYVLTGRGFEERSVRVVARNEFEAAVEGPVAAGDRLYPGRPPAYAPAKPDAAKKDAGA